MRDRMNLWRCYPFRWRHTFAKSCNSYEHSHVKPVLHFTQFGLSSFLGLAFVIDRKITLSCILQSLMQHITPTNPERPTRSVRVVVCCKCFNRFATTSANAFVLKPLGPCPPPSLHTFAPLFRSAQNVRRKYSEKGVPPHYWDISFSQ